MVTKVKLAHLNWASSVSCQRESVAANYCWHCLLPQILLSSGLHRAAISSTFDFPNESRKVLGLAVDRCWPKASVRIRSSNVDLLFPPLQLPLSIPYTAPDGMRFTVNGLARHKLGYQSMRRSGALHWYTSRLMLYH